MKKMIVLFLPPLILAVIFLSAPFLFAQQSTTPNNTLTLTTYYPAPFGAYKKLTVSDNVGIGTTAPGAILHVSGSSPETRIQTTSNTGEAILNLLNDTNKYLQIVMEGSNRGTTLAGITQDNTAWIESGGDNFLFTTSSAAPFIFAPNRVEALRITNGGNVGIGTTDPKKRLDVSGDIAIHMSPTDGGLYFGDDNPLNEKWHIGYWEPSILPPDGGLVFTETGVTDGILTLKAGGNVGIGTTGPEGKLNVNGYIRLDDPASPKALTIDPSDGAIQTGAGNLILQPLANNVGIGVTSPQSKLAVGGLPTVPPDTSGTAGMLCVTNNGNVWIDDDGTYDCE